MVQALQGGLLTVSADCVGFVFPMHYFGLPLQVEEFVEKLSISGCPYIFAVATCGVPYWGRPFMDLEQILQKKDCTLQAAWYWRLVSNYIPWRDLAAQWRINIRAWLAERKLVKICVAVKQRKLHTTWQLLPKFCQGYHEKWRQRQPQIDESFVCDTARCTGCGLCERICPRQNIIREGGAPVWQHNCVECLGCIHICPVRAIDYGEKTQGRKRYRHESIKPADLLLR
ncbi:4Fe-4S dicluster domain-containing protein [Selenomonas sp. GACV-9]|nr:4Fe-4S dicluster domain-containing protein [Selenomonas ruminantium]